MRLTWEGRVYNALQIGTVMTAIDYRKKGLAHKLLNVVMEEWDHKVDFIYLFGNDLAMNLYKQFNMVAFDEYRYFSDTSPKNSIGSLKKLDISKQNDLNLLIERASARVPISDGIGVSDDFHLLMFYCYKYLADKLYYIEHLNTIIVGEEVDQRFHLYDVISDKEHKMTSIISELPITDAREIEYHFKPSGSGLDIREEYLEKDDRTLLIRHKGIEPKERFRFSEFSHA